MIATPASPSRRTAASTLQVAAAPVAADDKIAQLLPIVLAALLLAATAYAVAAFRPGWRAWMAAADGLLISPTRADPAPSAAAPDPHLAVFTPEVQRWSADIKRWSASYGLPPELVATVMQIESCGAADVQSTAGAAGLFQVMPFHFSSGEDPLDVETNAARGLEYLARAMQLADGRSDLALAGYNGGHGQIRRPPSVWPEETQRYVRWGSGILEDVRAGVVPSPSLQAWLDAGGAHLCERASRQAMAAAG
jgi:soluble lytic murein transglycosylase-like protein